MPPPLFLTFEGIDGCGKTTQLELLAQRLRTIGRQVIETVEPGGTPLGRAIRSVLLDPRHTGMAAESELLLYFASRAQNVSEVIMPALHSGNVVLCDRFTDSTIVYQGAGRGIAPQVIRELHRVACGTLQPDITILLEIDLQTSLDRAHRRNLSIASTETRMDEESHSFFERVCAGYRLLSASEPERIRTVSGVGSVEAVAARVWETVEPYV